jgi:LacI family transcriptional regulator
VRPETAERIRKVAEAAGYRINPLAGAVMSELRRSSSNTFRGVIALLVLDEPGRPAYANKFYHEITHGAMESAKKLGFKTESLTSSGKTGVSMSRLNQILDSRGIQGVVILPVYGDPDFSGLDWTRFAGVYTDYSIRKPALHSICPDHYRSLVRALQKLHERGYKRPGLFMHRHTDERLLGRWQGAFLAFQNSITEKRPVPPLVADEINVDNFKKWFARHNPDVVIGHQSEAIEWMQACGARVPQTHGFFCLNMLRQHVPCAGLEQRTALIGARAVESVVAMLHRNERGIPEISSLTTIPSRWMDGPTVKGNAQG